MSCEGKIYVGQVGVLFEAETQGADCPIVDWADATTLEIVVLQPDGQIVTWPAGLSGTILTFLTTTANDIPLAGKYKIQGHVAGPGYDALGETAEIKVWDKFK